DQHRRRDDQVHPPEFLVAGDVLRRLAGGALGDGFGVACLLVGREFVLRMGVEVGAVGIEHEHQQRLGVHPRRADGVRRQRVDGRGEGLLKLHESRRRFYASASCFSFSAWKCVTNASMMGWILPSMMSLNWCSVSPMRWSVMRSCGKL